jgi:hypothetical protein
MHRVTAEVSEKVSEITFVGWARLLLLGPERNVLHEGLVAAAGELVDGRLVKQSPEAITGLLEHPRTPFPGNIADLEKRVGSSLSALDSLLRAQANKQAAILAKLLADRGVAAEKQARGLATERMSEIRRTIKHREKQLENPQLRLDLDSEEKTQFDHDLHALKSRLLELEQERDTEPKRQRQLFKVVDQRVHPLALQILIPAGPH